MKYRKLSIALGLFLVLLSISSPFALLGDTVADIVLGQFDFNHNGINLIDGHGFNGPFRVAIDKSVSPNRIYVTDYTNSRVLGWPDASAFANGDSATVVIGQPDFSSSLCNNGGVSARSLCLPRAVAVDGAGNLFVADESNHRVLEYDNPFGTDTVADRVFGQGGSFTLAVSNNGGISASSLSFPSGVATDAAGNLYVADRGNNRVLEYNGALTDTTADKVFGQGDNFTTGTANNGGRSERSLNAPFGVAIDGSGNLYIADPANHRVLEYDTPLTNDTVADRVFGQLSFATATTNADNKATSSSLRAPYDVALDGSGNLYVADNANHRVLEYNPPLTTNFVADHVFGQGGSFSSTTCVKGTASVSASTLCSVTGVATDGSGNLYVVDPDNNRVLEYNSPLTDSVADRVLGQYNFSNYTLNSIDGAGFSNPSGVAVDRSVLPSPIYVADYDNSRVLAWRDVSTLVNGQPADLVIGHPDFYSRACNNGNITLASNSTLCNPRALAVDSAGNLYVADTNNNRVLEFDSPFTTDAVADRVFGHSNFSDIGCNFVGGTTAVSANSLCNPNAVTVDTSGNLFVADYSNSRVLEYNSALSNNTANLVFGQPGFTSNACNNGGVTASSLCGPSGVAVDSAGNLYAADTSNSRVLEYTGALTDNVADLVFGQGGDFTTNIVNNGGISAGSLWLPRSVAVDGLDDLFVADTSNSRVLEYDRPLTLDTVADQVYGQPGFGSYTPNYGGLSATSMYSPYGVAVGDDLYVADTGNNRMLVIFIDLPPVVTDQSVTTPEDTPITITLSATDPDSPSVTFSINSNPPNGLLSAITGTTCTLVGFGSSCTAQVTYTPILNYNGPDSFTFKANDGLLDSNIGTVTLDVTPVNDPPVGDPQSVTTAEETPITITLSATDVDNTALTFGVAISPVFGTLSAIPIPTCTPNGQGATCTADVTYTPNLNYFGSDVFTFTANDGALDSIPAAIAITVTPVEDPPTAADQAVSTNEDTAVVITLKSEDVDGDALTYAIGTAPTNGTLSAISGTLCTPLGLSAECTAQVTYTPNADYNGPDSFTFTVNDGQMDSNVATVSMTVIPVNDPPVATGQSVTTAEDTPVTITFSATDIDSPSLTFVVVSPPNHGSLGAIGTPNCTPSGLGSSCTADVVYTPAANYNGPDSFTFGANDGTNVSTPAAVSVTITPVNDAPVANAQTVTTPEDTAATITLSAADIDSPALTFAIAGAPTHGTVGAITGTVCAPGGAGSICTAQVTYTPSLSYNGPDSFTFTVNDGSLPSTAATITVDITPVNDPPAANAQSVTTAEDTAATITLSATDIDSAALTFAVGTAPTHGTLGTIGTPNCTPSGGGAGCTADVLYTPAANYNGPDSFSFTVNDGSLSSTAATVSVTVIPVNDPPTTNAQSVTTTEDAPVTITLSAADIDSAGLTFAIASAPTHGTVGTITGTICAPSGAGANCTAQVTYTPILTYNGPDSFTFTVNDGSLNSTAATVSITVTPINDPPVANAQSVTTAEDTAATITLSGTDIDSAALTFAVVTAPAHGTLGTITGMTCTPSGLGSNCTALVAYTPNANYNGPDSFTFRVNDGSLPSTAATVAITVTAVNDAPVSAGQSVTTAEGAPVAISLSATDVDNAGLTFVVVTPPTHGTLGSFGTPTCTPNGGGSNCTAQVTYTPNPAYNGPDSFTFNTNDGILDSNTATVTLTVTAVNDPPTTTGQSVSTAEDTAVTITLSGTDIDSAALTFAVIAAPTHGVLGTITTNCTPSGLGSSCTGTVTYTPNANYNGADNFTFKANDGFLDSNNSTVSLTVTAVNDAPVSAGQSVTTVENAPVTITLSGADVDNAGLTFVIVTVPTHGTLGSFGTPVCAPSGLGSNCTATVTYTPNLTYNGPDSFTFKTNDGILDSNISTVSLTVTPVNDPPVSAGQSVTTAEDTAVTITLAATDVDSAALTFAIVAASTHGSLGAMTTNCTPSGLGSSCTAQVTYTPNLNYNGPDSFTFKANDGLADSNISTVNLTVTAVNDAPVSTGQSVTTNEDLPLIVTLSATDVDNATLTFSLVAAPSNGTVGAIGGTSCTPSGLGASCTAQVTYTPAANYNGPDTFTYKVNDGFLDSTTSTVSVTVTPVNNAPVANAQSVTTPEDTALGITLAATDIDSASLTFAVGTTSTHGSLSAISGTTCTPSGLGSSCTALVTYTPNLNYNGPDSFTFTANDGTLTSIPATVSITVTAVNDAPVAANDSVSVSKNSSNNVINVLTNDTDVESDPLTVTAVTAATNGTAAVGTGGANVTYTPNANYAGPDTFTYTISDGHGGTATATVSVSVGNGAPVASGQSVTTPEDVPVIITLTGSDPNGDPLTFAAGTAPTHGTLGTITQLTSTSANVTYTPNLNYNGTDSFTFTTNDGTTNSVPGTVSLTITAVNDAPAGNPQSPTTPEDTALVITLTATDVDNASLTFAIGTAPTHGSLSAISGTTCTPSGLGTSCTASVTYTPNLNYNGPDSFTFTASDGTLTSGSTPVLLTIAAVNDAPVAANDSASVSKNSTNNVINVLANDTDVDADTLTVTAVTAATSGTAAVGTGGANVTYTPNANFSGTDSFTYTASDGHGGTATATVSVSVGNGTPVANGQSVTTPEDVPVIITLTGSDPNGDALTFAVGTAPTHGTLGTITQLTSTSANVTYTPNLNYNGTDSFTFTTNDGTTNSTPATVSLTITAVNDAPVGNPQSPTTPEDTPKLITLSATDVENASLTFAIGTAPTHGALGTIGTPSCAAGTCTASVTYTPNLNYNGPDSFTFTANDGTLTSIPATVSITVTAVNDAPVAVNDAASVSKNSTNNVINVLANDTDVDADTLTVTAVGAATSGTAAVGTGGANVTYTPNANFSGSDSFTYTASDGHGGTSTATVSVSVGNGTPVANGQSVTTPEDVPVIITLTGSDPNGDALTFAVGTAPTHGTLGTITQLTSTSANVTYTPNLNYNGTDSFTFTTNDGTSNSTPATVSLTITAVNDAPVGNPQSPTTPEDTAKLITLSATDVENASLTFAIGTAPTHGALGTIGTPSCAAGTCTASVTYTPNLNYNGPDSFTFTANDGTLTSIPATVSITVTAVNDAPVAVNDAASVSKNSTNNVINVLANDTDVDADTLTVTAVGAATSGTAAVGTGGANVTYTPNANFSGSDSFTYTASDGHGGTSTATVSVSVGNGTPVANGQSVTTPEDVPVIITLTGSDPNGDALTFAVGTAPTHGTLGTITQLTSTSANVTYTPNLNYNGTDSFTFTTNDGTSNSTPATVSLTITAVNDAPVGNPQSPTTPEDTALVITLSATDVDNASLTFAIGTAPTQGALGTIGTPSCAAGTCTASVTYTPNLNYNGPDSFTFRASDGTLTSIPATVSITVTAVNDAPVAVNDAASVSKNSTNNVINVLANDTDVDADTLTVTAVGAATSGTAAVGTGGANVTYTPNANFSGSDSFTYTASDGHGGTSTATVSVSVGNGTPVANGQSVTTPEDVPVIITLTGSDPNGDALTFAVGTAPTHGSLGTITQLTSTSANVTYTPNLNYNGTDSFTFTTNDGTSNSTPGTVSLTITAVNDTPVGNPQSPTTAEDTAKVITLAATDVDSASLSFAIGTAPTHGTLGTIGTPTCAPSGGGSSCTASVTYTPNLNYNGPDSITFTASDGTLTSIPATVSITVTAVNDAPVAANDSASVSKNSTNNVINVLANDTDVDADTLTVTAVTAATSGTAAVGTGGANVTYTPNANFSGSDSFTYTASDGHGGTATATVSVSVGNGTPVANGQSVTTPENVAVIITLTGSDPNGDALTFAVGTAPTHGSLGTITQLTSTSANVTYTPTGGYSGPDSFTFTTNDGTSNSTPATVSITVTGVNSPPVGNPQSVSTAEDTAKVITLGATDIDSASMTFAVGTSPTHGSLSTITGTSCTGVGFGSSCTASVTYTPNGNYNGPDSFTFTANDGTLTSAPAMVSITVTAVNDAPVAANDSASVAKNSTNNVINVLANDTDVDADTLTVTAVTAATSGTAAVGGGGANVTYTPNANFSGSDSFTYTASDGHGGTSTATVSVSVGNGTPVANGQSVTTPEDVAVIITLTGSDPNGDALTFAVGTAPTHGSLGAITQLTSTSANVTYTPNLNYNGADSFTFMTNDGTSNSSPATVSLTITAVNDAPVGNPQSPTTPEDAALVITLAATDVDNASLTFAIATGPTHGSLGTIGTPSCIPSGGGTSCTASVTYTPNLNYNGPDSFTFRASDGTLTSAAAVSITVTAVNDAPVAANDAASVSKNSTNNVINVLANDTDVDADTLTVTAVGAATSGTAAVGGGGANVTYTPNANFSGSDSFTYTASDGHGGTSTATVSVSVGNGTPVANGQSVTTPEDVPVIITLTGSDPNGDALTFAVGTAPTHGSLGTITQLTSTSANVTYTPAANYNGTDSFTFMTNDGTSNSSPATVSLTITAVNDAPAGTPQSQTTAEDTAKLITLAATDVDSGSLTFAVGTAPTHGSLSTISGTSCTPSGGGTSCTASVTYTPNLNYNGPDSFTFTATDGTLTSVSAPVTLTITAVNDAPVAGNDSASVAKNSTNNVINVLANDTDVDADTLTVTAVGAATSGTAAVGGGGANVTYTPNANFSGSDSFTYTASDGHGGTSTATVSVSVGNGTPVANGQSVTTPEDVPVIITLTGSDPNGDALTFAVGTAPTHGTLGTITQLTTTSANVTYTPAANYNGTDSFTFTTNDGTSNSNPGTVSLTITAVNDAPAGTPQSQTTAEDTAKLITLAATDVDSASLTFAIGTAPTHGSLSTITGTSCAPSGGGSNCTASVTYTPNLNYNGPDSFTFTATDGTLTSASAAVTLTITAVNDAPVAGNDSASVAKNSTNNVINVLANDTDVDADTLTVTAVTAATSGTAAVGGGGANVTYTPNANFSGSDSFTYTASDGHGGTSTATVSVSVGNGTPVANGQSVTTPEDVPVIITLTGSDPNGDALTFAVGTAPTHGTLGTITQLTTTSANVTYTPNLNYNGTDSFTFTTNDGTSNSTPATVSLTITAVNDAPAGTPQGQTTAEDTAKLITLAATDVDSGSLTFAVGTAPTHGSLSTITGTSCAPSGGGSSCTASVTYTPNLNYNGPDSFTFTATDGTLTSAAATVSLTITAVNDAPVASNDSASVAKNSTNNVIAVLANDTDVDADTLTVTAVTAATSGTAAVGGGGANVTYTPNANFSGSDSFTYTASDGHGGTSTATVSVIVGNGTPVANGQSVTTPEDVAVIITLTGSDPNGDALTFAVGTAPTHGSLGTITQLTTTSANVTYTPNLNYNGTDSFTFTTNDGTSNSTPATVSLTITAVNDTPVGAAQTPTTAEDAALVVTLAATDVDSASLSFTIGTAPTHGSLGTIGTPSCTPSGGGTSCTAVVTYTPNLNYNGPDSFTFRASDGTLTSIPATVSITVTAVNDAPVAANDSASVSKNSTNNVIAVLTNDTDVDGDTLTVTAVGAATSGTAAVGGGGANVTYTPNANFSGSDSFTYTASDGHGGTSTATVSVSVGNGTPVANGQSVTTPEDVPVIITLTGSDPNGDALTFAVGTAPTHGTLGTITQLTTTSANVTYTPNLNYNGTDSFTFTTNDGTSNSTPATVSLTITAVNDAPVGAGQAPTTPEDTAKVITLAATDVDSGSLSFAIGTGPTHGGLSTITGTSCAPSGGGSSCTAVVTYTPNANYNGADSFTFTASDGTLTSAAATVSLTITAVNDSPVAANDAASVSKNSTNNVINVLSNDTDVDGDTLTVTAVTAATSGTAAVGGGGANVTYTPNANFSGSDSFTYTASDGHGGTSTATVSVSVGNGTPVANGQSVTTPEDVPVIITLTGSDPNGDALTFAVGTAPTHGTLGTITQLTTTSANVTYTPAANYNGTDSFTFVTNDGTSNSSPATVSLTITAVNDTPVGAAQTPTTAEDAALVVTLAATDVDSASLSFTIGTAPTHGSLGTIGTPSCTPSGGGTSCTAVVTYTPNLNYNGPDSFTFRASDGTLTSVPATVSITITAVNDAPVAVNDSASVSKNSTNNVINVLSNDTDVDADTLTVTAVTAATSGTAAVGTGGANVTYTPNANFSGSDSFTYTASDGHGGTSTATVSVSVGNGTPVANGQSVSTAEDVPVVITLTGSDPNADPLTFSIVGVPTHGGLGAITGTNCAAGTCTAQVTYTPAANYNGADSFAFKVNDGSSDSNVAAVTLTVTPANDAPVAAGQAQTTPEDTAKVITLAGTDIDSASLTFTIATNPTHGSLGSIGAPSCTPSGGGTSCTAQVTYTPAANYNGPDSFTFTTNDGSFPSPAATVSITVTAVNDGPAANGQAVTASKNVAKTITLAGSDIDSASLTFAVGTAPTHGTLGSIGAPSCTPSGGGTSCTAQVTYTSNATYSGPDSFTFTVNDGSLTSPAATVSVTVGNDAPAASGQSVTTAEDAVLVVTLSGTDANGDPLTFAVGTNPTHGSLGSIGAPSCAAGTCTAQVTYTPNANYNGADSFTFTVNDGSLTSPAATVSITVTGVSDAPVAAGQAQTTPEDTAKVITLAGTDVDSASLTFAVGTAPIHGTLGALGAPSCTPSGGGTSCTAQVTYTPAANYNGADSFTFTVNDGSLTSPAATVSITVTAVNDVPAANGQAVTASKNVAKTITLAGSDIDSASLTFAVGTAPTHGTLGALGAPSCTPSGGGTSCTAQVTYTPNATYSGPDSFTFTVNDGSLTSPAATVSVTVGNDAPAAAGQAQTTPEDTALVITLSGTDANADPLTFAIGTNPTHGSLGSIGAPSCAAGTCTAQVTYTPAANYNGADSFTFTVNDGTLTSPAATVSITVTAVSDAPVAAGQAQTTPEDTAKVITLAGTDVDSASLTFAVGTAPTHGSLGALGAPSCTPSGGGTSCTAQVTYTPAANYSGADGFTFTVNDGSLTSPAAVVSITMTVVNDAPVAAGQAQTTPEDTALVITLAATDVDNASLTFAVGTSPTHGTLGTLGAPSCTPSGGGTSCTAQVTYTPAANYSGADGFTFTASDGSLTSPAATVNLTVTAVNDPPAAADQGVTTAEDTALAVTLSGTDIDSASLTFAIGTNPTHGSLGTQGGPSCTPSGGGTSCTAQVIYTPAADYNGPDSFTFTVYDGSLTSLTGTVSVTVTAVNDAPVANADAYSTAEDTPLTVPAPGVLSNDTDVDSPNLTAILVSGPTHGNLTLNSDGSFSYTPNSNFNGTDSFTYKANDGSLDSNVATVSLTITAVNDPPVANGQSVTTLVDTPVAITLAGNDVDGNTLTFAIGTSPTQGTLGTIGTPACAAGSCTAQVTYTPNTTYTGPDSFTFTVNDGSLNSTAATVGITVNP